MKEIHEAPEGHVQTDIFEGLSNNEKVTLIYEKYYSLVIDFLSNMLKRDTETARELAASTFLKITRSITKLQGTNEVVVKSWVKRIATNVLYDYGRKKNLDSFYFVRDSGQEKNNDFDPLKELEGKDFLKHVNEALKSIGKREAQIFRMFYFQNMSGAEISEELGIQQATVRASIKNAKERIKPKIKRLFGKSIY